MGIDRTNKYKKKLEEQTEEFEGEGTAAGSAPDQENDSDVDKIYEDTFGHPPPEASEDKDGTTIADEVKAAEDERRGKPGHEDDEEEADESEE